jgi:hypothetical protein
VSVLLEAGASIKAVSQYLGHSEPGLTLRVYTHMMPGSSDRAKVALDAVWHVPVMYPDVAASPEAPRIPDLQRLATTSDPSDSGDLSEGPALGPPFLGAWRAVRIVARTAATTRFRAGSTYAAADAPEPEPPVPAMGV